MFLLEISDPDVPFFLLHSIFFTDNINLYHISLQLFFGNPHWNSYPHLYQIYSGAFMALSHLSVPTFKPSNGEKKKKRQNSHIHPVTDPL